MTCNENADAHTHTHISQMQLRTRYLWHQQRHCPKRTRLSACVSLLDALIACFHRMVNCMTRVHYQPERLIRDNLHAFIVSWLHYFFVSRWSLFLWDRSFFSLFQAISFFCLFVISWYFLSFKKNLPCTSSYSWYCFHLFHNYVY